MNTSSKGRRANQDLTRRGLAGPDSISSPELAWENEGGHLLPSLPDDTDLALAMPAGTSH